MRNRPRRHPSSLSPTGHLYATPHTYTQTHSQLRIHVCNKYECSALHCGYINGDGRKLGWVPLCARAVSVGGWLAVRWWPSIALRKSTIILLRCTSSLATVRCLYHTVQMAVAWAPKHPSANAAEETVWLMSLLVGVDVPTSLQLNICSYWHRGWQRCVCVWLCAIVTTAFSAVQICFAASRSIQESFTAMQQESPVRHSQP